jgi:hypothetical protein
MPRNPDGLRILDQNGQEVFFWTSRTDVLVRQLLKVCIFENFVQGSDQIVIGAIALCPVSRGVACDLRIEIIIIIAQPIERLGIFVMTDRAQRAGKTPKKFAFCGGLLMA